MIKTQTGRISRTQVLQIICTVLQTINVSAFVALGFPAEYVALATMIITAVQSGLSMYLRKVTVEPLL